MVARPDGGGAIIPRGPPLDSRSTSECTNHRADMKENASSSLDTEESWRGIELARMLGQYQSPNGQNDYLPRNNAPKVQV
jgi:hypothetical protein